MHEMCRFWSVERSDVATNSELRRWFERGSVEVGGQKVKAGELVCSPVPSLVLHPNGKRKATIL